MSKMLSEILDGDLSSSGLDEFNSVADSFNYIPFFPTIQEAQFELDVCWRHQEKVRHQRFSRKKTLDFLESDPQTCPRMSKVSKII